MTPPEVIQAVRGNGLEAFKQVKGIGEKTAQRLILELKSVVDEFDLDELAPPDAVDADDEQMKDLRAALKKLGYDTPTINAVIDQLGKAIEQADDVEPLIRRDLSIFGS